MKKQLLYLILGLFFNLNAYSTYLSETGNDDLINDGPYIFNVNNEFVVKWLKITAPGKILLRRTISPE